MKNIYYYETSTSYLAHLHFPKPNILTITVIKFTLSMHFSSLKLAQVLSSLNPFILPGDRFFQSIHKITRVSSSIGCFLTFLLLSILKLALKHFILCDQFTFSVVFTFFKLSFIDADLGYLKNTSTFHFSLLAELTGVNFSFWSDFFAEIIEQMTIYKYSDKKAPIFWMIDNNFPMSCFMSLFSLIVAISFLLKHPLFIFVEMV